MNTNLLQQTSCGFLQEVGFIRLSPVSTSYLFAIGLFNQKGR